jgi:hypothetical protein
VKHSAKALARQARNGPSVSKGEGSGSSRRLVRQLPYWIVMAGVVAGLVTARGGGQAVRGGTLVIAGALLAGSLARLVLPEGKAGLLASRRRIVDVGVLGVLGVGLLVAGLIVAVPD